MGQSPAESVTFSYIIIIRMKQNRRVVFYKSIFFEGIFDIKHFLLRKSMKMFFYFVNIIIDE